MAEDTCSYCYDCAVCGHGGREIDELFHDAAFEASRLRTALQEIRDMFLADVEGVCRQQCAMDDDDWRTCTHCVIERINAALNSTRTTE